MKQKIFILSSLIIYLIIITGCSKNTPTINQEDKFSYSIESIGTEKSLGEEEYLNVNSLSNGISFEANFHTDACEHDYSYKREGNHLIIIQNLQLETCDDIFTWSSVKGEVENLPKGDYRISIYYRYDKSLYGENTEPKEILSKNIEVK